MNATQQQRGAVLRRAALIALCACAAASCDSGQKNDTVAPASADAAPPILPAPAVTQASWAPDALEELLAPIALYPDVLLSQILAASVNAQEVLDAGNWLLENEALQGDQLDAAAQQAGFGPATRALIQFPTVVDMMCQELDWTRQVGSAFSSDQKAVLDAVQRLRLQAANAGALQSTKEQKVEQKTENQKTVIEVKPAEPTVVYVPQYDPQVVYAATPAPAAPEEDTVSTGTAVAAGLLAFGVGVIVGNAFDDDDYCYPHWGYGAVYYGPRPFYPPAYVYRPAYGPAFRPAYGYRPPANYRHSYNNININNDININTRNSDNYFNRFDGNQNLRAGGAKSPLRPTQQPVGQQRIAQQPAERQRSAQRDAPRTTDRTNDWKGQSTYAGDRDGAGSARLAEAANERPQKSARDASGAGAAPTRPEGLDAAGGERGRGDRGYGETLGAEQRQASVAERESRAPSELGAERERALDGARQADSGEFDRAASARGRGSTEHQRASRGSRRR